MSGLLSRRLKHLSGGHVAALAVGDVAVFAAFAFLGRSAHNEGVNIGEIATIAAPFALGWLAVSPWTGMFRAEVATQPKTALGRTAATWALAGPVGLGLRALFGRDVPLSFAITTLIINCVLLLIWRGLAAWRLR